MTKLKKMINDSLVLEEQGSKNVCVVKVINKTTGDLEPKCIQFSQWFDSTIIILSLYPTDKGTYNIVFRDKILFKDKKINEIIPFLDDYTIDGTKTLRSTASVFVDLVLKKKRKKKEAGKKNKDDKKKKVHNTRKV